MLEQIGRFLRIHSIHPSGPAFTRWHPANEAGEPDVEVGYPVCMPVAGVGEVMGDVLPGGEVVATCPFGPMGDPGEASAALDAWCAEHGRTASGPEWELHWAEPGARIGITSWRTEVVRPLTPRAS